MTDPITHHPQSEDLIHLAWLYATAAEFGRMLVWRRWRQLAGIPIEKKQETT